MTIASNAELAPAVARPASESAPETRAARAGARAPTAPAVHTRAPSTADLTREVRRQTESMSRAVRMISKSEGMKRLNELKQRALKTARDASDQQHRAARRGRGDVLLAETQRRANVAIDTARDRETATLRAENQRLRRAMARPPIQARGASRSRLGQAQQMHREAVINYLRTGEQTYRGHSLTQLERMAVRTSFGGSNPEGGFLLVPETDTGPIEKLLAEFVPMRSHATVKQINSYTFKKPVRTETGGAKWGNELNDGGDTESNKYAMLDFPAFDLYAKPAVSQNLLEDSPWSIEQEIADGSFEDFAIAETVAFVSGNGVERPFGFLGYGADKYVANAEWGWGKVGWLKTGAAGAFPTPTSAVGSADPILKLQYELKQIYRQNAKWMCNRSVIGTCRTLKDVEGRYVWTENNIITGTPATLDGREVIEAEQMPDMAGDSFSLALADWARFYMIVDRVGMTVLRDPYTKHPLIVFHTRKRVGGGIQNFEAGKLLKFSN